MEGVTSAAAHAAGFAMPAFIKAAAIFCCCVMSAALVGPGSGESWITPGRSGGDCSCRNIAVELRIMLKAAG